MDSYFWFFYIGIFLFISHFLTQGISLDISFFGIFLIIVGWWRIQLWSWIYVLTWIFIVIEILANIFRLQELVGNYLDPSGQLEKDIHDSGSDSGSDSDSDSGSDTSDENSDESGKKSGKKSEQE